MRKRRAPPDNGPLSSGQVFGGKSYLRRLGQQPSRRLPRALTGGRPFLRSGPGRVVERAYREAGPGPGSGGHGLWHILRGTLCSLFWGSFRFYDVFQGRIRVMQPSDIKIQDQKHQTGLLGTTAGGARLPER